jgi:protein-S-isoprenylcysteine O-methyltransferase Ste14
MYVMERRTLVSTSRLSSASDRERMAINKLISAYGGPWQFALRVVLLCIGVAAIVVNIVAPHMSWLASTLILVVVVGLFASFLLPHTTKPKTDNPTR